MSDSSNYVHKNLEKALIIGITKSDETRRFLYIHIYPIYLQVCEESKIPPNRQITLNYKDFSDRFNGSRFEDEDFGPFGKHPFRSDQKAHPFKKY